MVSEIADLQSRNFERTAHWARTELDEKCASQYIKRGNVIFVYPWHKGDNEVVVILTVLVVCMEIRDSARYYFELVVGGVR